MVHLTGPCAAQMRTFGYKMATRGNFKKSLAKHNHRVPIQYKRFMAKIEPEKIIEYYSRDDIDQLDPREGERTYLDATKTMYRKKAILPNLSDRDLEMNEIFQQELDRQRAIVARISKIRVVIDSLPGKDTELSMNRDLSTPFDCARHVHELLTTRSVVAEVLPLETSLSSSSDTPEEGKSSPISSDEDPDKGKELVIRNDETHRPVYWDMHRPLTDDCRIKFKHFTDKNLSEVNKIYWRSCSFVMGMAIRLAFKDNIKVLLHSWPKPNIKSGSFIYDVALSLSEKWQPNEQELRAFTKVMWDIKAAALPFERLQVNRDIAQKIFSSNPFKLAQVDSILENESSQGKVTVYRCGGLLDMSIGPMISNTNQIGRISLAAVHPFESDLPQYKGIFYRFQGVSLPQQLPVSSYLYQNILLNHAKKLNRVAI